MRPPTPPRPAVAMLAFISMPLTGTVFAHKPAFIKHRALRFYPPSAFGGAFLAQELPMMLVCSALFSSKWGRYRCNRKSVDFVSITRLVLAADALAASGLRPMCQ